MLTEKTIQTIRDTAQIEEVVGDFVTLKRRGANLMGLCPFHGEKTPSFTVSPAKGIYKCFGCGKGGDSLRFIMDHENISYVEALRYLAKKYNIEVEETITTDEYKAEKLHNESLQLVNDFAQKFFAQQLFETPEGKSIGLSYFKERGFREETIRKFGLGFAVDSPRDLFLKTATTAQYNRTLIEELGLVKNGIDFFRQRVMFTIHGLAGKPIAFAGRIMQKDAKAPKYVNSPESILYHKSKVLYAMNFAKRFIQQHDECILVEGYTDVISLHQAGIENVVASSGTSLTVEQIRLIKRFTNNIKVIYDGDAAGINAALRGTDMILAEDMNVRVVPLPIGEDPDSFMQQVGITAFTEYIQQKATDFIAFKTQLLLKEAEGDPIAKSQLIRQILESISHIPNPIKQNLYAKETAKKWDIDENVILQEVKKLTRKQREKEEKAQQKATTASQQQEENPPPSDNHEQIKEVYGEKSHDTPVATDLLPSHHQELELLRVLVQHGHKQIASMNASVATFILQNIQDIIGWFHHLLLQKVIKEINDLVLVQQLPLSDTYFIRHNDTEIQHFAVTANTEKFTFAAWNKHDLYMNQPMPEDNYLNDTKQVVHSLKFYKVDEMIAANQQELKEAEKHKDKDKITKCLLVCIKLDEMKKNLANILQMAIF